MPKSFLLFTRRDDSSFHFVEAAETFEAAKDRAITFSKLWPREYIIFNEMTGLKFFFDPRTINQIIGTVPSEARHLFPAIVGIVFGVLHKVRSQRGLLEICSFFKTVLERAAHSIFHNPGQCLISRASPYIDRQSVHASTPLQI
jgi:hypothetical protein